MSRPVWLLTEIPAHTMAPPPLKLSLSTMLDWFYLDQLGSIWISLVLSGSAWFYLDQFGSSKSADTMNRCPV
ncbi:hypothetical protein TNCV_3703661 [Trichonephila clavipes]|nr:hypothetical protein TNCV_3703661 [Trichonephila clavipes]